MSFFKFDEDDIFINTLKTYPEYKFYIQSGSVYIDDIPHLSGANTDNIIGVPKGFVSLYEYNSDRPSGNDIYPFVVKSGKKDCFKTISTSSFANAFQYGDILTSSYNMSASITRIYFSGSTRPKIKALKNTFNHYMYLSPHYEYAPSDERYTWDKDSQTINLISVPSILYGSKIKRGSVNLKFYVSGSLLGELSDYRNNGELVQVGPAGSTGSGSVAGVVLYNEGIMALTGAWSLDNNSIAWDYTGGNSKWIYFGYGANDGNYPKPTIPTNQDTSLSASFVMAYSGTVNIQTLTMLAHANYGQINHSTNPTFVSQSSVSRGELFLTSTGSKKYFQEDTHIENIVPAIYTDVKPRFEKTVYISKIGIYDENRNLIAIAKMATPVRKTDDKQYTFKLKVDI